MKGLVGLRVDGLFILPLAAAVLAVGIFRTTSAELPGRQGARPAVSSGWTIEETTAEWILKPRNVGPSERSMIVITKQQKANGSLPKYFDGLWAAIGSPPLLSRNGQSVRGKTGKWDTISQGGIVSGGPKDVYVVLMALQQGDRQFSMKIVTDAGERLTTYAAEADRAVLSMIGSTAAASSGKGRFTFKATFPAQWARQDGPGLLGARRVDQFGQIDRMLNMFEDEPIQGSLEQTFEAIWAREVTRLGMRMEDPGLQPPQRPQPLKRRLKNGLAVWFEGGVGKLGPFGKNCYMQVYMIPTEKTVTEVAVIYAVRMEQTSSEDRAATWEFLESLRSEESIPKQPLFGMADCVGTWRMTLTASLAGFYSATTGAYLGDASSGGIDDLSLKADGTYARLFAGKGPFTAFSWQESGTWTVDDSILTLMPKSSSDPKHAKRQEHRLYGRGVFDNKVNLIVGAADDSRLPTDAREAGALVEVATRGGALLRYKEHREPGE